MSSLQAAYRLANTSDHMVHADKVPRLVKRTYPEKDGKQTAYFVRLTIVGSPRDLST